MPGPLTQEELLGEALCESCFDWHEPAQSILADPLGALLGEISVSAGPFLVTAVLLDFYGGQGTSAVPLFTALSVQSQLNAVLRLYQHGTKVEVGDWYDATMLRRTASVIGEWTDDYVVYRNVWIDTNVSEYGRFFLGEAADGTGSDSLEYDLRYVYPEKPQELRMELTFGTGPSGIPLGGQQTYSLIVAGVYDGF
jgi:hypothetical protein